MKRIGERRELKSEGSMSRRVRIRFSKYLNNIVEQDHLRIKRRIVNVHGGELRLTLAAAIDTVLAYQGKGIRENIQRRRQIAAHRAHLELIPFVSFAIRFQQQTLRLTSCTR